MRRSQNGDPEAFRELVNDIGPAIARFIRRRIADLAEIEDVCQETLLAIYKSRHTYQPGRPIEPWVFAIARNVRARHLSEKMTRHQWEESSDEFSEPSTGAEQALGIAVRRALDELPQTQREAFTMLKVEGLSLAEASKRTGASIGTIKVRAHRAYERLKKSLIA
ncbi:MAG TPA: RNA polymerase sigma factor [Candidatus Binataceae bacterium]|nr:RNA polymerase sigma factor [Candidatus Binataceae bacterium]